MSTSAAMYQAFPEPSEAAQRHHANGANVGNIVCNRILNDNLSGNNVAISVL